MYTPEANNRVCHGWMHRYGHVKSGPQRKPDIYVTAEVLMRSFRIFLGQ